MQQTTIYLNYNRADFEEIYYVNDQHKYLKDPRTRSLLIGTVVCLLATVVAIIYYSSTKKGFEYLVWAIAFLFLFCSVLYDHTKTLRNWRKEVIQYLDKLSGYKQQYLTLSDNAFSLVQDDKETVEKWSNLDNLEIERNHINFSSPKHTYLFPKKSMTDEEFLFLKNLVSEKIRAGSEIAPTTE